MRVKERICPKRCRVPDAVRHTRQRMIITVEEERVSRRRVDLVMNWYCPTCGHTEPMSSKDIRQISRHRKDSGAIVVQKKYYPEIKRLGE